MSLKGLNRNQGQPKAELQSKAEEAFKEKLNEVIDLAYEAGIDNRGDVMSLPIKDLYWHLTHSGELAAQQPSAGQVAGTEHGSAAQLDFHIADNAHPPFIGIYKPEASGEPGRDLVQFTLPSDPAKRNALENAVIALVNAANA